MPDIKAITHRLYVVKKLETIIIGVDILKKIRWVLDFANVKIIKESEKLI